MSDNAQPSQMGSDDVFVLETNDLGGGRPRPINDSLLERFVRTPAFIIASYTVYLLLLIFFWNPIENTLGFVPGGILFALIGILPLVGLTVANATTRQTRTEIPFYRDLLTIQEIIQLAFVALILGTLATLILNLNDNLAESGLTINFNVLARDFGTEVSEGPDPRADWTFLQSIPLVGETLYNIPIFTPDTYFRALAAGFANTLRVVWLSLIFSTILGVALGIGLLSNNWLVRNVSFGWVEIFRNTPLLVQLFFIYNGVIRLFPARPGDALSFPGSIFLSSRGF
ncbi:MAG: ABC transporter permease subunit, partial [Chloroflexota bacterium]